MVKNVPLWSANSLFDPDIDVSKVCRYVAKYASKSRNTWFYKFEYSSFLEKPKLFSSRYFGHGVTALRSNSDKVRREYRNTKISAISADIQTLPAVPRIVDGQYNLAYLKLITSLLRIEVNGVPYKTPAYLYKDYFPKDIEDYEITVPLKRPKTPSEVLAFRQAGFPFKTVVRKRQKAFSKDDSLSESVSLSTALSRFRQIAIDGVLVRKYEEWLSDHPGHAREDSPVQDHEFYFEYVRSEEFQNALLCAFGESTANEYYRRSLF